MVNQFIVENYIDSTVTRSKRRKQRAASIIAPSAKRFGRDAALGGQFSMSNRQL
jgi:hypothetical protein